MKFTKVRRFTESNEIRILTYKSQGKITNKLVIYIGYEIIDKYFSESNYLNVKIVKDKLGRNDIYLSKYVSDTKSKKYKLRVTSHITKKLIINMPEDTDMNKYINNKAVVYSDVDNTLILHIDSKTKIKTARKTKKSEVTENNINTQNSSLISENVKYDSSIIDLLYEFDFKNYNRYGSLKGLLYEIKSYLKELLVDQIKYRHKTEERLRELENKVKNIKEDKRSLFGRIFGE